MESAGSVALWNNYLSGGSLAASAGCPAELLLLGRVAGASHGGLTELLPLGTISGVFRGNFGPRSSNSAGG